jgi:hypothetical protein
MEHIPCAKLARIVLLAADGKPNSVIARIAGYRKCACLTLRRKRALRSRPNLGLLILGLVRGARLALVHAGPIVPG